MNFQKVFPILKAIYQFLVGFAYGASLAAVGLSITAAFLVGFSTNIGFTFLISSIFILSSLLMGIERMEKQNKTFLHLLYLAIFILIILVLRMALGIIAFPSTIILVMSLAVGTLSSTALAYR